MDRALLVGIIVIFCLDVSVCVRGKESLVTSMPITGQKDLEFREGENPCKVLKKYCKSVSVPEDSCFEQLHPHVIKHLTTLWETVSTKLKVSAEFFIDCQPLNNQPYASTDPNLPADELKLSAGNSSKVIEEMLSLLRKALRRDTDALQLFNTKRNELKLSDEDRLEMYRKAILILPNNLFIVDQLGLSLMYLNQEPKARKLFENAVRRDLWENAMQRPVSKYVRRLTSKPWHNTADYPFIAALEKGIPDMKAELLLNLKERPHIFTDEQENLHVGGQWTELRLKSSGHSGFTAQAALFPKTVQHFQECGQEFISIKISAIQPGTYIRPHTGPSNERLRIHLTLLHTGGAKLRVGSEWRTWEEGKATMFDDSWEHEVMHLGKDIRVVIICDVWHPQLPQAQRIIH